MGDERGCSPASVALAFIVGGALGASLALLFAPERGRKTRARLRDLATDVKDRGVELVEEVKEGVEDVIGAGKEALGETLEETKAIFKRR